MSIIILERKLIATRKCKHFFSYIKN